MVNWLELGEHHEKYIGQHKAISILHSRSGGKPWERLSSAIKTVYFKYVKIGLRLNKSIAKNEPSPDPQGITALTSHLLKVQRSLR